MHIAILNCLKPIQAWTCLDMFKNLIDRGLDYNNDHVTISDISISYEIYNCFVDESPISYAGIDAIIRTGAPKSAYEPQSWIKEIHDVLRGMVPAFWAFGRQRYMYDTDNNQDVITSALLEDHGIRVEKNPKGWEKGVHSVELAPRFLRHFPRSTNTGMAVQRKVQFIPQYQVTVPDGSLPLDWIILRMNDLCDVQRLFQPNRVLTYQGHAEFDRATTKAVLEMVNNPAWSKEERGAPERLDDADYYAGILVEFLLG
ncbi:hypothetical protein AFGD_007494 [Aspergillus flavus]|nr:hypothetical protein AFGD_007494 [Aspergillus flavus]